MTKELYFFLTKEELIKVFQELEYLLNIKYIESKGYNSKNIREFSSIRELDELGKNKSGNQQSESFLVVEQSHDVFVRTVEQVDGGILHYVDQMNNEESIVFWPGGIFDNKYFICGHIGTININEISKKMFNCIRKKLISQCSTKVGRYYIGDEARRLYDSFRFITININQPEEYDIKL